MSALDEAIDDCLHRGELFGAAGSDPPEFFETATRPESGDDLVEPAQLQAPHRLQSRGYRLDRRRNRLGYRLLRYGRRRLGLMPGHWYSPSTALSLFPRTWPR